MPRTDLGGQNSPFGHGIGVDVPSGHVFPAVQSEQPSTESSSGDSLKVPSGHGKGVVVPLGQ